MAGLTVAGVDLWSSPWLTALLKMAHLCVWLPDEQTAVISSGETLL